MKKIQVIFAVGNWCPAVEAYAFGYNNGLPWGFIKEDLQNFKQETYGTILIMGAGTFASLPKMLPGRMHVVVADKRGEVKTKSNETPHVTVTSLQAAIDACQNYSSGNYDGIDISIIGGPSLIYQGTKIADKVIVSHIKTKKPVLADTFLHFDVDNFQDFTEFKTVKFRKLTDHDGPDIASFEINYGYRNAE